MPAMEPFVTHTGRTAPLRLVNVDTDMIIPKQYLKLITRTGLGEGLLIERRLLDDGMPDPEFALNQPRYEGASILIAGDNFGCGSSREQAPWALMDCGFRCVISTSFGDIFFNNCFKNGLLPVRVQPDELEQLFVHAETANDPSLTVDLEAEEIRLPAGGGGISFATSPYQRRLLLDGLDEVAMTLKRDPEIAAFETRHAANRPWLLQDRTQP